MKLSNALTTLAITGALAASNTQRRQTAACPAVNLDAKTNVWTKYTLQPNPAYSKQIDSAVSTLSDASLAAAAKAVAKIGVFLTIDSVASIATIETALTGMPCDHILGAVLSNLPGRDCSNNGTITEFKVGELSRYQKEYIDPIATIIKAHPNSAFALIVEPGAIGNIVSNGPKLASCNASADGYRAGMVYALQTLNLPNVVTYLDAAHSQWLGWTSKLPHAGQMLVDIYTAAGKPSQLRGISTNLGNWNSFDQTPEFNNPNNTAGNEKMYVGLLAPMLQAGGMPNFAIVDMARNGVMGLRNVSGHWCNLKGAGFGARPSANTGDPNTDAFIWVKQGGYSDGTSDPTSARYNAACGDDDAFKPSPDSGTWNQAYFEMLVKNAKPPLV